MAHDESVNLQLLSTNNYLIIEKMRDGGFTASHPAEYRNPSHAMFACTNIDELLAYIKKNWGPALVQPTEPPKGFAPATQCSVCKSSGMGQYCGRADCPHRVALQCKN